MHIKGEKVLLRAIEFSDVELLRAMMNDETIEEMVWGYSFPVSEHQQKKWIENLPNDASTLRAIVEADGRAVPLCSRTLICATETRRSTSN